MPEHFIRAVFSVNSPHMLFFTIRNAVTVCFFLLTHLLHIFFLSPAATAAATTESKGMTSLPTPSAHQLTSDTQMEQLPSERRAKEVSRMPPDGHEFPSNRMSNGIEKQLKRFVRINFSLSRRILCLLFYFASPQFCGFKNVYERHGRNKLTMRQLLLISLRSSHSQQ